MFTAFAIAVASVASGLAPPPAGGGDRVMTLYSPAIQTSPYVHDTHRLELKPDGAEAPAAPGYITGIKEQVLVDSKDPDAKPLDNSRFMIHHFAYFARDRVDETPGGCWKGLGYLMSRGEEDPTGDFSSWSTPATRARYGIVNRTADGRAPGWSLVAMVMNHEKRPKQVYVRTRIWYTTQPREALQPVVLGDCKHLINGMSYDVPGGGGRGSEFTDESEWTVPDDFSGRILLASSHHHGGAKDHTLDSRTCDRRLYSADAYYGPPDHIYNRIRPILHEPSPIANGAFRSAEGVPISGGEVLRRRAVHDNANLHVQAMSFWIMHVVRDPAVKRCAPLPADLREIDRPTRYDRTPPFGLRVPQLARPGPSPLRPAGEAPLRVADTGFDPGRVLGRVGEPLTWEFASKAPHTVTVANGPRGFSSVYSGRTSGRYTFTPRKRGTYRLTCLVHPTTMGQTVVVR